MHHRSKALAVFSSLPVKGAIVGIVATEALDVISTLIYKREDRRTWFAENRARGFMHAYEVAVKRMAKLVGKNLSRREAKVWGWRFHKAFGAFGGIQYMAARRARPSVGKFAGLGFGTFFFGVADELLMPLLKLTPGPRKFSWKVHARGAISHIAYGVAAELTARALERSEALLAQRFESKEDEGDRATLVDIGGPQNSEGLDPLAHQARSIEAFSPRLA